MTQNKSNQKNHLGFLATIDSPSGLVGGYLVTSTTGRPLEFQCTTPVKANRTQEILFGNTLLPFLKCELLAKTLFQKITVNVGLIIVDDKDLLDARANSNCPVVYMPENWSIDQGAKSLEFAEGNPDDEDACMASIGELSPHVDLLEPVSRVRDALSETVRAGAVA